MNFFCPKHFSNLPYVLPLRYDRRNRPLFSDVFRIDWTTRTDHVDSTNHSAISKTRRFLEFYFEQLPPRMLLCPTQLCDNVNMERKSSDVGNNAVKCRRKSINVEKNTVTVDCYLYVVLLYLPMVLRLKKQQ